MEPLTAEEARLLLAQCTLGHLGMTLGGRAYVLPIFYAYDGRHVYFHSHPGQKDDFLAATGEACLAVTRVQAEDAWESVLVFGPVEEVLAPQDRLAAMDALIDLPMPPSFGTSAQGEPRRSGLRVRVWRLLPVRMTGRKSVRQPERQGMAVPDVV